jgi:hypothetical protein
MECSLQTFSGLDRNEIGARRASANDNFFRETEQ